jgi:transcription initiation factor TFIIB
MYYSVDTRAHTGPGGCDCVHLEDQVVVHTREGDTICTTCARVIEAHAIEQSEWLDRETARGTGPNRDDEFLDSRNGAVFEHKKRYTEPDQHKTTRLGLRAVEQCAIALRLNADHVIARSAKTYYTDYAEARRAQGRNVRESERHAAAACALYFGCKAHERTGDRVSRTIKEISGNCDVPLQDMTDIAKSFKQLLAHKPYHKLLFTAVNASDLLGRAVMGISFGATTEKNRVLKRARAVFEHVSQNDLLEGRTPETVCSAVLYRAFELEGIEVTKKNVYTACAVSNVTLNKALKDLKAHV